MSNIYFFEEDISFNIPNQNEIILWLTQIIKNKGFELEELNYIFCSDHYLLQMNQTYLNHDTLTDIITFDNSETEQTIEGDIFISIERVKENSLKFDVPFETELSRVIVHGLLHLFGYKDKSENEEAIMRKEEDACLSLLSI
jgi:probable rRNA maturation factor